MIDDTTIYVWIQQQLLDFLTWVVCVCLLVFAAVVLIARKL